MGDASRASASTRSGHGSESRVRVCEALPSQAVRSVGCIRQTWGDPGATRHSGRRDASSRRPASVNELVSIVGAEEDGRDRAGPGCPDPPNGVQDPAVGASREPAFRARRASTLSNCARMLVPIPLHRRLVPRCVPGANRGANSPGLLWTAVDACGQGGLPLRAVWTPVDTLWRSTDQEVGGSSPSGRATESL